MDNTPIPPDQGLVDLITTLTGEGPLYHGQAFNIHYATSNTFIKVTRSWVRPERFHTETRMASALAKLDIPLALPLTPAPLSYKDSEGQTRWVTVWEKLTPSGVLTSSEATSVCAAWAMRLWAVPPPHGATLFQLEDFLHAVHVRLDRLDKTPLAVKVIEGVEKLSSHPAYYAPKRAGLIHGDLHNDNIMMSTEGLKIIDWESSCVGPLEWDAAQNLRYCSSEDLPSREAWWKTKPVDWEVVQFYRHVRSLSSLSHMVATGVRSQLYYDALKYLDFERFDER